MHTHDRAAILSIGDELTLGQRLDTNAQWLAERLTERGIRIVEHTTIPDDLDAHLAALHRLSAAAPLIVSTGGLGPTADDLTRDALARALNEPLIEDPSTLATLADFLARRGRDTTPNQRLQALRPASAQHLSNPFGTAPGIWAEGRINAQPCTLVCLPGPPNEMHPMWRTHVEPRLRPPPGARVITRVLHLIGLGESDAAARLAELMRRDRNPLVGTTASGGIVSVRIRYEGHDPSADAIVRNTEADVRRRLDPYLFADSDHTLQSTVLDLLRLTNARLLTVESCTGGLLGALLTSVPGSSRAYLGGWVTYANELKSVQVGVPDDLLRAHGAVSAPVARAMALGALRSPSGAGAHHALAITGIAGPHGATESKPVGTVYIGRAARSSTGDIETETRRFLITGDREAVRDRSAKLALAMLRFHLIGVPAPRLLWEVPD